MIQVDVCVHHATDLRRPADTLTLLGIDSNGESLRHSKSEKTTQKPKKNNSNDKLNDLNDKNDNKKESETPADGMI